jgi:hexosaminidase
MKYLFLLLFSVSAFAQNKYAVIPKPASLTPQKGEFVINHQTQIIIPKAEPEIKNLAQLLAEKIRISSGINIPIEAITWTSKTPMKGKIVFLPFVDEMDGKNLASEDYSLQVHASHVVIAASTAKGQFYALQTLFQLLPTQIFSSTKAANAKWNIPACVIFDHPRYAYRGLHLDVSRHFFPVSFVKKYIDLLAMHKMNSFHWHLTDDQGWRIEIKKYPKLTQIGSKRKETMKGHYTDQTYDQTPYGGFYTQEEIKDVIRYAQSKYVNIIPEIEMPGHALAALAAYPELGCKGSGYEVGTRWGVYDEVFCPTEKTFSFLEDVLSEVIALFPSQYIHIGGDECPKISWKENEFCQNLMKKEGLKDEHELQSYFIKRIDRFLTQKGKKIIGWDEILEGGISPNATIMSWRGIEGGVAAAKQKHDAIMTPGSHCYLDYYQSDPATEPLAIGGFLPLEKVYAYNPTPAELNTEEAKHILGVQGNVWSEYIKTSDKAEYMAYPRATALSEVAWTPPNLKNYKDFTERLKVHFERLTNLGVNYAKSYYDVSASTGMNSNNEVIQKLQTADSQAIIKYTTDGTLPQKSSTVYDSKGVVLKQSGFIKAAAFNVAGEQLGKVLEKYIALTSSTGRVYTLKDEPNTYFGGETYALTNGIKGEEANAATWVGFSGKDLEFVLDLGKIQAINKVSMAFLGASESWIMIPRWAEVLVSGDGKVFKSVKKIELGLTPAKGRSIRQIGISMNQEKARFIKVFAKNYGKLPENHPGQGNSAWLFVDEIEVE